MGIAQILNLERPLVFFDLETTGLYSAVDRIVQIGVKKYLPNGDVVVWKTLVNPTIPIIAEATETHGITDEMVSDSPTFKSIAEKLHIALRNSDLGGYNVKLFDIPFLKAEFKRAGIEWEFTGHVLDGFVLYKHLYPRDLGTVYESLTGKKLEGAHDAMVDVEATVEVIEALFEKFQIPRSLEDLSKILYETPRPGAVDADARFVWRGDVAVINFGEHAGTPLSQIPIKYLSWITRSSFSPRVKQIALEATKGIYPKK